MQLGPPISPGTDGRKSHSADRTRAWLKRLAAPLIGIGALLLKAKALLFFLLHLQFLGFIGTLGLSLWLYVVAFGWRFALVLTIVLVAHEFGHYAAFRGYGLAVRLPNFVPFLGAFTAGTVPASLEEDGYISLAGPLTGLGLAAACGSIATFAPNPIWNAVAYFSALLNLFNLIPVGFFDGGRIVRAIFPPANDPRAATHDGAARLRVAGAYLGTAIGLLWIVIATHHAIARPV